MSQYSAYLCYSTHMHMYMYHLPHAWPMASEPTAPLLPSVQPAPLLPAVQPAPLSAAVQPAVQFAAVQQVSRVCA